MLDEAPTTILNKARSILEDRANLYDPDGEGFEENFSRAAAIATLILRQDVSAREIAVILMAVKMARIASQPTHEDSYVDLCNYAAFASVLSTPTLEEAKTFANGNAALNAEDE